MHSCSMWACDLYNNMLRLLGRGMSGQYRNNVGTNSPRRWYRHSRALIGGSWPNQCSSFKAQLRQARRLVIDDALLLLHLVLPQVFKSNCAERDMKSCLSIPSLSHLLPLKEQKAAASRRAKVSEHVLEASVKSLPQQPLVDCVSLCAAGA